MTNKLICALFVALLAAGQAAAAGKSRPGSGGDWDASIYAYTGSVLVQPAGTKRWANARKGFPLKAGDTVRTGKRSSADVSLDGRGIIAINASSEFGLRDLKRRDSSFVLRTGRFIMKITGLKQRMEKLSVRTPTAVAAVRGTEFAVTFDKNLAETLVNVFEEGEVLVSSLDENGNQVGESIVVIPRHEVRVRKEMEAMSLAQSPAQTYKDPGIFSVRKKLSTLDKEYRQPDKKEREEARAEALGGKRPAGTEAAYGEDAQEARAETAAQNKPGRKKAAAEGAAKGGASSEGGGGGGARAKAAGESGSYSRQGAAARDSGADGDRDGTGEGGKKYRKGGDKDGDDGFHFAGMR